MDNSFITIVQKLIAEQGKAVLFDAAKCKAFLADYTRNEYKKESRLLLQALEAGVGTALDRTNEPEICKKQQARILREDYFLAEEIAVDVVETIALVLEKEEPPKPAETPLSALPEPAEPVIPHTITPATPVNGSPAQSSVAAASAAPPALSAASARRNALMLMVAMLVIALAAGGIYVARYRQSQSANELMPPPVVVPENGPKNAADEIAKTFKSAVFEGYDPAESIQRYYFVPLSADELAAFKSDLSKNGNTGMVSANASDTGVAKARQAGYKANYGAIVYGEDGTTVIRPVEVRAAAGSVVQPAAPRPAPAPAAAVQPVPNPAPAPVPAPAVQHSPAEGFINSGVAYNNKGDYDQAIADYTQAIRLDPSNARAYYYRGLAHRSKSKFDQAIADFNQAIRLDPNNAQVFYYRGEMHLKVKYNYDQANADFTQVIRLDPYNAKAYLARGKSFIPKTSYLDQIIADCNQAIRLDPDYAEAYEERGFIYYLKSDYARARADCNKAIQLDPNSYGAINTLFIMEN